MCDIAVQEGFVGKFCQWPPWEMTDRNDQNYWFWAICLLITPENNLS